MAEPVRSFADLGLPAPLLDALAAVGYETPTPIQARTVPPLLAGRDVLGHAPTGTGKTAAFALPILARLDPGAKHVQALVLTPTRELAIQVAEAFTRYASASPRLRVLPVYGGQDYTGQLKALARGVQVVVGTPGRVTDHVKRGTLVLDSLTTLVLDEADEMLRMGFVDEVEWLLEQTPAKRQTALFSATMPPPIRRIAKRHLNDPEEIGIEGRRSAATTIRQRVWMVGGGMDKLEALTRILEVEPFEAMLVFVRTKSSTVELAEKLEARGFAAQAMNGDMPQKERERQVDKLRGGRLDILVATDVVARGLDVDRISHVVNYDIPYDTEAYVHRIGRTGRAGRSGEAILFVVPRERRLLGAIEHATKQKIEPLTLPTVEMVNERRVEAFEAGIDDVLAGGNLGFLERLVERYAERREVPMTRVAAALARLAIGERPLLLEERATKGKPKKKARADETRVSKPRDARTGKATPAASAASAIESRPPATPAPPVAVEPAPGASDAGAGDTSSGTPSPPSATTSPTAPAKAEAAAPDADRDSHRSPSREPVRAASPSSASPALVMERFRVEVGRTHGVEVSNIVGAIASEADIRAEFIGRVDVHDDHSLVDLPEGMPKFMLKELKRVWVCGRQLGIARAGADGGSRVPAAGRPGGDARAAMARRPPKRSADSAPRTKTGGKGDKTGKRTGGAAGKASDRATTGKAPFSKPFSKDKEKDKDKGTNKGKGKPVEGRGAGAAARVSTHRKGTTRKGG